MTDHSAIRPAPPVQIGIEDKFHFEISDACIRCGVCTKSCPVQAIFPGSAHYEIDPSLCIDCGTCSSVCPTGAAHSPLLRRESPPLSALDPETCYFNPGCVLTMYKPELPPLMWQLLKEHFGNVRFHDVCCHHDPHLPSGSVIINNCAGCDRRFRSLYGGIQTISFWEVIDSIPDLPLPDYHGMQMSVHDPCGFRHKPQVHAAVRSLLRKMNIEVIEAEHRGITSECCGDNLYGHADNEVIEARIRRRAAELPCRDIVVYCIGCERAMLDAGRIGRYLPDLLFGRTEPRVPDSLDTYHRRMKEYIHTH